MPLAIAARAQNGAVGAAARALSGAAAAALATGDTPPEPPPFSGLLAALAGECLQAVTLLAADASGGEALRTRGGIFPIELEGF